MAKRPLPPQIPSRTGEGKEFDGREYLRHAVEVLSEIDVDQLDEAGKVTYALALATVAVASNSKHLQQLPMIVGDLTGLRPNRTLGDPM